MHPDLKNLIASERKYKRELQELRDLRAKVMKQKAPDQKVLTLIDTDIALYTGKS